MMNERIQKLAEWDAVNRKQIADLTDTLIKDLAVSSGIYDCVTDPYDKLKNGDQYSSVMPDLVRFAESIVRECIAQLDIAEVPIPIQAGLNLGKVAIKNHFGVEQ